MAQRSRQNVPLGEQLRWWRRHAQWSRRQLAARAGTSISTIQNLERGSGTLTYYTLALRALDLQLRVRGLGKRRPGSALQYERRAQSITRRDLARHLAVSRNTLARLDANLSVRLSTLEAYARAIGASLVVVQLPGDERGGGDGGQLIDRVRGSREDR
jgi:transcriptional regulator with XRE-family HTH domain